MIEPLVSLAFSMYSNKGVYALLVGSGLSRAAGVPTGWDVVLDLVTKLARINSVDPAPTPEAWYAATYNEEPDYSNLLDQIAKTSTERTQLLHGYFEASEEERDSGLKMPTAAHRAIAELMEKGYIRLAITTNFDRLLETALADRGVAATVVSTADALEGMVPLPHAHNLIVKINGDYLDARIKNTRAELETYDDRIARFLDRVFDEFGLIVCGWSGDWDVGLRAAIERCRSRRFTTYWAARGELGPKAKDLVNLRRAEVVSITEADTFFKTLAEKVLAFEDLQATHPASAKIAVAQAKRYLSRADRLIDLHDLVRTEADRVCAVISGSAFSPDKPWHDEEFRRRAASYEAAVNTLLHVGMCCAYWGEARHGRVLPDAIARIANCTVPRRGGNTGWLDVRLYPAALLLYGIGIVALAADRFGNIATAFSARIWNWQGDRDSPAPRALNGRALDDVSKALPGMDDRRTPWSDHAHAILREPAREYIPDDTAYTSHFDWFEYLLALCVWDQKPEWAPVGAFGWRSDKELLRLGEDDPRLAALMRSAISAGLFGGDAERFRAVRAAFQKWVMGVVRGWH